MTSRFSRRASAVIALMLCAGLAAACSSSSTHTSTNPPGSASPAAATSAATGTTSSATASTTYPLDITNCGRTLHFPASPKRIVSLWPSITEMLIALGAGDRIAGQAFTDQSPPLPQYQAAYDKVKVLATDAVNRETLLAARPDLIVADGEYHFDGKELPSMSDLAKLGIPVYIVSSFCNGAVTTGHVTDVNTDLTALGTILNTTAQAGTVKAQLASQLSAAQASVAGKPTVPLVLCQVFDKALYADAEGLYSDVVTLAGGTNLFDGKLPANQYYAQVSTEDVAKTDPGTIVYLYNSDDEKASTLQYLRTTFPTVDAVKNNRLIPLPSVDFIDMRAVDGVVALAQALHTSS